MTTFCVVAAALRRSAVARWSASLVRLLGHPEQIQDPCHGRRAQNVAIPATFLSVPPGRLSPADPERFHTIVAMAPASFITTLLTANGFRRFRATCSKTGTRPITRNLIGLFPADRPALTWHARSTRRTAPTTRGGSCLHRSAPSSCSAPRTSSRTGRNRSRAT